MTGWNHHRQYAGDLLRDIAIMLVRVADRVDPPSPVSPPSWWLCLQDEAPKMTVNPTTIKWRRTGQVG